MYPWILQDCSFCDSKRIYCQLYFLSSELQRVSLNSKAEGWWPGSGCIIPAERDPIGNNPVMSNLPLTQGNSRGHRKGRGRENAKVSPSPRQQLRFRTADWLLCVMFFWARTPPLWSLSASHSSSSSTVILDWKEAEWNGRKFPLFPPTPDDWITAKRYSMLFFSC